MSDTLSDYEEGIWEARLQQDGVEHSPIQPARYTMTETVMVFLTAAFDVPSITGVVTGFPFVPKAGTLDQSTHGGAVSIVYERELP